MLVSRPACPALRPFITTLWAADPGPQTAGATGLREHVLPTGDMHLAFRLSGPGLRVFSGYADATGRTLGHALVGGARTHYYVRETGAMGRSAGAQLRPEACQALFGVPASALAQAHTPLDLLWGAQAQQVLDQLDAAGDAARRLDCLERLLAPRLLAARRPPGFIAQGQRLLRAGGSVRAAVEQSGLSHRHFIAVFRDSTGLAPQAFARLQRFRSALDSLAAANRTPLAALALDAGYADQAHFQRDFKAFAGLTPQQWRLAAPAHANHVPVRPAEPAARSNPFNTRQAAAA